MLGLRNREPVQEILKISEKSQPFEALLDDLENFQVINQAKIVPRGQ